MDSQESRDFWSFAAKVGCLAPVDGFAFGTDVSDFITNPSITNIQQDVPPEAAASGTTASPAKKECRYIWLTWLDDNGTELKRLYGAPIRIVGNLFEVRKNGNHLGTFTGTPSRRERRTMRLPLDLHVKPDEPVLSFVPPPAGSSSAAASAASSAAAPQHEFHRQQHRNTRCGFLEQRRNSSDGCLEHRECSSGKCVLTPASPDTAYAHNGGCLLVHPADLHPQPSSAGDGAATVAAAERSSREAQVPAVAAARTTSTAEEEESALPPSLQSRFCSQQEEQVLEGPRRKLRRTSCSAAAGDGSRDTRQQIQQKDSLAATEGDKRGTSPPSQKPSSSQRKGRLLPGNNHQSLEEEMIDERQRRRWKGVTRYAWSDRGKLILLSNAAGLWLYAGCKAIEATIPAYSNSQGQQFRSPLQSDGTLASGAAAVAAAADSCATAAADPARPAAAAGGAPTEPVVQYVACSAESAEVEATAVAANEEGKDAQQQQQPVAAAADVAQETGRALPSAAAVDGAATGSSSLPHCSAAEARGGGSPSVSKPFLLLRRPSSSGSSILSASFAPDSSRIAFVYAQDLHVVALRPRQRQRPQQQAQCSRPCIKQSSGTPAPVAPVAAREGLSPATRAATGAAVVASVPTRRSQQIVGSDKPETFSEVAAHATADEEEKEGEEGMEEDTLVSGGVCMLTTSGKEGKVVNGLAEYIAQEEMERVHGYWWSPCGNYMAFCQYEEQHIPPLCLQRLNLPRYYYEQRTDGQAVLPCTTAAVVPASQTEPPAAAADGVAAFAETEKAAAGSTGGSAGRHQEEQEQQQRAARSARAAAGAATLNSEGKSPAGGRATGNAGDTGHGAADSPAAEEWLDDAEQRQTKPGSFPSVGSAAQEEGAGDRQQVGKSITAAPASEESAIAWPLTDEFHRFPFAGTPNVCIRVGILQVPSAPAICAAAMHASTSFTASSATTKNTAAAASSPSFASAPPYFCIESPLVACRSCRTPCRCAAPGISGSFSLGCRERFISLPVVDWREDFYVARVNWVSVASWQDLVLLQLLTAAEAVQLEQLLLLQQQQEATLQDTESTEKNQQPQQSGRTRCISPPPLVVLQLQDRMQQELRLCVALPLCVEDLLQDGKRAEAAGANESAGREARAEEGREEGEQGKKQKEEKKKEQEGRVEEKRRGKTERKLRCVVCFQEKSSLFINLHDDFQQIGKTLWYIWTAERDSCKDIFLQNLALPGQSFRVLRMHQTLRVHQVLGCTDTRYSSRQQQYVLFSFFPQKQPTSHHIALAALPSAEQLRQLERQSLPAAAAAAAEAGGRTPAAAGATAAAAAGAQQQQLMGWSERVRRWGVKGRWSIAVRELQLPVTFLTNPLVEGQHTMTLCKEFPLAVHQHHSVNSPRQLWVRYFPDWDEVFAASCMHFKAGGLGGGAGGVGEGGGAAARGGGEAQEQPLFYSLRDAALHAEQVYSREAAAAAKRKRRQQHQQQKEQRLATEEVAEEEEGGGEQQAKEKGKEKTSGSASSRRSDAGAAAADRDRRERGEEEEKRWQWDRDINGELFDGCEELLYVYGEAAAGGQVLFEFSEVQRIFLLLLRELQLPAFFTCSSSSGETLYSVCYRPDPSLHGYGPHRAVVSLYGGPTVQFVPNAFDLLLDMRAQALARLGLVVVKTDNRGSRGRSVAFEKKSIYLQLGAAELEDQKAAVLFLHRHDIVSLHAKDARYFSPSPSLRRPEHSSVSRKAGSRGSGEPGGGEPGGREPSGSSSSSEAEDGLSAAGQRRQQQQQQRQQQRHEPQLQQQRPGEHGPQREEGHERGGGGVAAAARASGLFVEWTSAADSSSAPPLHSNSSSGRSGEHPAVATSAALATPAALATSAAPAAFTAAAAELQSDARAGERRKEEEEERGEEALSRRSSSSSGNVGENDSLLPAGVGIYGMSYGGYLAALALFKHGDIFSCGWSAAPVTTWELYSTHFTERYLSTPQRNAEGYRSSSVLSHVKGLDPRSHRLKLVHGYLDENVHMQHSLALLRRMLECQFPAEFICLPQSRHGPSVPAERLFFAQEHILFFAESLLPPSKRPRRPRGVSQRSVQQQQEQQRKQQEQQQQQCIP